MPGALGVATNVWASLGGWREGASAMGVDDEEGDKLESYQIAALIEISGGTGLGWAKRSLTPC